jgi:hypothetical protein
VTLRLLIIGGYGTFGARLARLLDDEPGVEIIIGGRNLEKAKACAADLKGEGRTAIHFDRDGDVDAQIAAIKPDVVVDASGPWQAYRDPYKTVRAAISNGCHYLDLADGSDFVLGIGDYDDAARAKNVFVLSGVSSCPVLTASAVRALSGDLDEVHTIIGAIAPSPHAGLGANVIGAITHYAGKPVKLTRDGKTATAMGLIETRRGTVAPPGALPLPNVLYSLVDVPDLRLLPALWPNLKTIWFGVGPRPEILHRALSGLAHLVRIGVLRSLTPFAGLFHRAAHIVTWGEHRGGMFVEITGTKEGGTVRRSWHLLADGDRGPFIPSMAIEAVIRKMIAGETPACGARSAALELDLSDYAASFARRGIITGTREEPDPAWPLYRRVLGNAWERLPAPIRDLHSPDGHMKASGRAKVERGSGFLGKLIGRLIGFPEAGDDIPVTVDFKVEQGREVWTRTFGTRSFSSVQTEGQGRHAYLVRERFGAVEVSLASVVDGDVLRLIVRSWRFLGIPMPLFLAPGGAAFEHAEGGRFNFDVTIAHPLMGTIIRYRGWLVPEAA